MKNRIKAILAVTALLVAVPFAAQAKTTVMGGPYTNLKQTGQVIHLALTGFPTTAGLYILECVQSPDSNRPALCNQGAQLWVSNAQGATYAPTADIQFKPTGTFTSGSSTVDCSTVSCGIFVRLDHTAPTDFSEDQFIPLSFVASAAPTLPTDVITATVNGKTLSSGRPLDVKYHDVFTVDSSAKSGVAVTYASLAPACAIDGNRVTVLKGAGYCDIAITSAGNSQYAEVTAHFPLKLNLGTQIVTIKKSGAQGSKMKLPTTTNFGEQVHYTLPKAPSQNSSICTIKGSTLSLHKKGTCVLHIHAAGLADTYGALDQKVKISVK